MKIILYYKDLKHDIDQWTYRASEGKITDPSVLDDAQQDDSSSSTSYCMRLFEGGVAHLKSRIGSELDNSTKDSNDKLNVNNAFWAFSFKEDAEISVDSKAIAEAFHRFVLLHAFRDWATKYLPEIVKAVEALYTDAEAQAINALFSLDAPVKHRRSKLEDDLKSVIEIEANASLENQVSNTEITPDTPTTPTTPLTSNSDD